MDTSSVEDMSYMFYGCPNFNQSLNSDCFECQEYGIMFCGCVSFNKPLDTWDADKC